MPPPALATRFAPSPTGEIHPGNARTALFNRLLARQSGGRYVLRIEDTDASRSSPALAAGLVDDLRWLGLDWDEGPGTEGPFAPYEQSRRGAIYERMAARLEAGDLTYPCYCTPVELELARRAQLASGRPPRYGGTCAQLSMQERRDREARGLVASVRFRVPPARTVEFTDLVRGEQRFATDDIGDFVIRRTDGTAAFFFSNAIDDALMGITHVLRGEDHLSNTPRQLLLLEALSLPAPTYGHLALLVGTDGGRLSKRNGAMSVRELRDRGYLPVAITNHLFRLGHSTPDHALMDAASMACAFDLRHLGRSPAHFELAQLEGWQKQAVHALDARGFAAWAQAHLPEGIEGPALEAFVEAVRPNVLLPGEVGEWAQVVFGVAPEPSEVGLAVIRNAGPAFFRVAADAVAGAGQPELAPIVAAVRAATGRKGPELFKPLRLALTGRDHGPELAPLVRAMPAGVLRERCLRYASET